MKNNFVFNLLGIELRLPTLLLEDLSPRGWDAVTFPRTAGASCKAGGWRSAARGSQEAREGVAPAPLSARPREVTGAPDSDSRSSRGREGTGPAGRSGRRRRGPSGARRAPGNFARSAAPGPAARGRSSPCGSAAATLLLPRHVTGPLALAHPRRDGNSAARGGGGEGASPRDRRAARGPPGRLRPRGSRVRGCPAPFQ